MHCYSPCPQPCSRPMLIHTVARDSQTPTGMSPMESMFISLESWCTRFCCALWVYFLVLCKFCLLYRGVNGDLLQEDLCHSHTQSPCPWGGPQLTCTSTGDAQTQFCLSLGGISGSWWAQGLFGPSESLWQEQGLILSANSPDLLSCHLRRNWVAIIVNKRVVNEVLGCSSKTTKWFLFVSKANHSNSW